MNEYRFRFFYHEGLIDIEVVLNADSVPAACAKLKENLGGINSVGASAYCGDVEFNFAMRDEINVEEAEMFLEWTSDPEVKL